VSDVIEFSREGFLVLSGDDPTTLPLMALGGHGVISVTSNVAPREMAAMVDAFFSGDIDGARRLHYKLAPLYRALFIETNPIPVKTALAMMGMIAAEFKLPLVAMSGTNRDRLAKALKDYGLGLKEG
jgi:4-hydroxy-tetrahydrodipicolinate synthase